MLRHLRIQAQQGLRDVTLYHFYLVAQVGPEFHSIFFEQRIEYRGFFHDLFKPALRRIRFLPPDQQINPSNLRQIHQRICQPYFANKSGHSNQHHVPARQGPLHRKARLLLASLEVHNRTLQCRRLPLRTNHCRLQILERDIQLPRQRLRRTPPVRTLLLDSRESPARPDHRLKQSARRHSIAKLQPVCHQPLHPKMQRQRLHHMLQPLAYQHHVGAGTHQFLHFLHATRLQLRFQFVQEVFFTQQIEPVPRHPSQSRMNHARRKLPIRRIKKRTQRRHQENQPPSPDPLREGLRIPRKERDRLHHRQIKQAPLHPPVDGWRHSG